MLWQRASSQSPCGVRMLIECNHRNLRELAPGSSQVDIYSGDSKEESESSNAEEKNGDTDEADKDGEQEENTEEESSEK